MDRLTKHLAGTKYDHDQSSHAGGRGKGGWVGQTELTEEQQSTQPEFLAGTTWTEAPRFGPNRGRLAIEAVFTDEYLASLGVDLEAKYGNAQDARVDIIQRAAIYGGRVFYDPVNGLVALVREEAFDVEEFTRLGDQYDGPEPEAMSQAMSEALEEWFIRGMSREGETVNQRGERRVKEVLDTVTALQKAAPIGPTVIRIEPPTAGEFVKTEEGPDGETVTKVGWAQGLYYKPYSSIRTAGDASYRRQRVQTIALNMRNQFGDGYFTAEPQGSEEQTFSPYFSTLVHEWGHAIGFQSGRSDAQRAALFETYKRIPNEDVNGFVTEYGLTNAYEMEAEAFASWFIHENGLDWSGKYQYAAKFAEDSLGVSGKDVEFITADGVAIPVVKRADVVGIRCSMNPEEGSLLVYDDGSTEAVNDLVDVVKHLAGTASDHDQSSHGRRGSGSSPWGALLTPGEMERLRKPEKKVAKVGIKDWLAMFGLSPEDASSMGDEGAGETALLEQAAQMAEDYILNNAEEFFPDATYAPDEFEKFGYRFVEQFLRFGPEDYELRPETPDVVRELLDEMREAQPDKNLDMTTLLYRGADALAQFGYSLWSREVALGPEVLSLDDYRLMAVARQSLTTSLYETLQENGTVWSQTERFALELANQPDYEEQYLVSAIDRPEAKREVQRIVTEGLKQFDGRDLLAVHALGRFADSAVLTSVLDDPDMDIMVYRSRDGGIGFSPNTDLEPAMGGAVVGTVDDPRIADAMRESLSRSLVSAWAQTSNKTAVATAVQRAALEEFGLEQAARTTFMPQNLPLPERSARLEEWQEERKAAEPMLRAFLRAQYVATQKMLRERFPGATHLRLYRGGDSPERYRDGEEAIKREAIERVGRAQPVEATLMLRPLASFSMSVSRMGAGAFSGEETMFAADVPIERIMSTAATGIGAAIEGEFVVLGGPIAGVAAEKVLTWDDRSALEAARFNVDPTEFITIDGMPVPIGKSVVKHLQGTEFDHDQSTHAGGRGRGGATSSGGGVGGTRFRKATSGYDVAESLRLPATGPTLVEVPQASGARKLIPAEYASQWLQEQAAAWQDRFQSELGDYRYDVWSEDPEAFPGPQWLAGRTQRIVENTYIDDELGTRVVVHPYVASTLSENEVTQFLRNVEMMQAAAPVEGLTVLIEPQMRANASFVGGAAGRWNEPTPYLHQYTAEGPNGEVILYPVDADREGSYMGDDWGPTRWLPKFYLPEQTPLLSILADQSPGGSDGQFVSSREATQKYGPLFETLAHEWGHAVDWKQGGRAAQYTNTARGQQNPAPEIISNFVAENSSNAVPSYALDNNGEAYAEGFAAWFLSQVASDSTFKPFAAAMNDRFKWDEFITLPSGQVIPVDKAARRVVGILCDRRPGGHSTLLFDDGSEEVAKHLAGEHDQSTHGSWAAGRAGFKAVEGFKDTKVAREWLGLGRIRYNTAADMKQAVVEDLAATLGDVTNEQAVAFVMEIHEAVRGFDDFSLASTVTDLFDFAGILSEEQWAEREEDWDFSLSPSGQLTARLQALDSGDPAIIEATIAALGIPFEMSDGVSGPLPYERPDGRAPDMLIHREEEAGRITAIDFASTPIERARMKAYRLALDEAFPTEDIPLTFWRSEDIARGNYLGPLHEHIADAAVATWATTSNKTALSQALQAAIREEFNLEATRYTAEQQYLADSGDALFNAHRHVFTPMVRRQYERTQQFLRDIHGDDVTHIRLYRGRNWEGSLKEDDEGRLIPVPIVDTNPLSSWSSVRDTALQFASWSSMRGQKAGRHAAVESLVPVERIFSTPATGVGALNEFEHTVLGGRLPVDAVMDVVWTTAGTGGGPFSDRTYSEVFVTLPDGRVIPLDEYTPTTLAKHLAGKHDQKTHGRWAGSIPHMSGDFSMMDRLRDSSAIRSLATVKKTPGSNDISVYATPERPDYRVQYPTPSIRLLNNRDEAYAALPPEEQAALQWLARKEGMGGSLPDSIRFGRQLWEEDILGAYRDPAYSDKQAAVFLDAVSKMEAMDVAQTFLDAYRLAKAEGLSEAHSLRLGHAQLLRTGRYVGIMNGEKAVQAYDDAGVELGEDPEILRYRPTLERRDIADGIVLNGQVAVAVHLRSLPDIIADGALKNQYQSGESSGMYAPEKRKTYETAYIGVDVDTPAKDRPIYGYVYDPSRAGQPTVFTGESMGYQATLGTSNVDQYGDVRLVLKPDVRERTTVTGGDSLDRKTLAVPLAGRLSDEDMMLAGLYNAYPYFEAQVHRGVKMSDIESVHIPQKWTDAGQADAEFQRMRDLRRDVEEMFRAAGLTIPVTMPDFITTPRGTVIPIGEEE